MKNDSSLKTKNTIESPKTPGGISKNLLTPCRRLGLSRKWKKSGPSPFVSPLASTNNNELGKVSESRKRKTAVSPETEDNVEIKIENKNNIVSSPYTSNLQTHDDSSNTPKRTNLRRKKSKTLEMALETIENLKNTNEVSVVQEKVTSTAINLKDNSEPIIKLSRVPSRSEISKESFKILDKRETQLENGKLVEYIEPVMQEEEPKPISPSNLAKECIVVIQKKMLKSTQKIICNENNSKSQVLFDSDSDDVPLCQINKNNDISNKDTQEEEYSTRYATSDIVHKQLKNKNSLEKSAISKTKTKLTKGKPKKNTESIPTSQSSNTFDDDDDDFDFNPKKTILIKKTYNKVTKPLKAKSTGSITDKDIEEIRARIEAKKNVLLTRFINPETENLRCLIKKWQRGCQDALMELMELMKKQMPEENVGNSEILQMLKIPPDLVGFDSENDCFITPDDEHLILNSLNLIS